MMENASAEKRRHFFIFQANIPSVFNGDTQPLIAPDDTKSAKAARSLYIYQNFQLTPASICQPPSSSMYLL